MSEEDLVKNYEKECMRLWTVFERLIAPAKREYNKTTDEASIKYQAAIAGHSENYQKSLEITLQNYRKKMAAGKYTTRT